MQRSAMRHGEIAAQAVDELGFSYETVKADVWVACKVEPVRWRTGLSWMGVLALADPPMLALLSPRG